MAVLFAVLAATAWGSSDFAAGLASRRSTALSVVILTHLASAVALLVVVADVGALASGQVSFHGSPTGIDLVWGAAAGLGGGVGALLLFRGLGRGSMAVVAPITAAGSAVIPAVFGLVIGESLGPLALAGLVAAIGAIVLISLSGAPEPDASSASAQPAGGGVATLTRTSPTTSLRSALAVPGVVDALLAGVGFGAFFVCISRAGEAAGDWPLLVSRTLSFSLFAAMAMATRAAVLPARQARPSVILAGVLDAAAAFCFVLATRHGLLSVGAVLASLYPAATVVLARVIVHERIGRRQIKGLVLAVAAVTLLTI